MRETHEMPECPNARMHKNTERHRVAFCIFAFLHFCLLAFLLFPSSSAFAQTRLAVLQAEDRRASTPGDLAILRSGSRSSDLQIAQASVRALGRLERPSLIPDILVSFRHPMSEMRAEAANA